MRCTAVTRRFGQQCRFEAMPGSELCFRHDPSTLPARQLASARARATRKEFLENKPAIRDPFEMSFDELDRIVARLTSRQMQAIEHLSRGETYRETAALLDRSSGSFTVRMSKALGRTGVRSRAQLIAIYAVWKGRKAGERMR